jgi:hypothetical protein
LKKKDPDKSEKAENVVEKFLQNTKVPAKPEPTSKHTSSF